MTGDAPAQGPSPAQRASDRGALLLRRFVLLWVPVLVGLIAVEVSSAPIADNRGLAALVVLTAVTGVATILAGLSLSRGSSLPLPVIAAALTDVAGIATGLVSAAGNDAAIMLPFLGAVLLVGVLDRRSLVLAFTVQWCSGMVGAIAAYGFSDLRLVPSADPLVVSLTTSGAMSFIGYGLLWWVRDRLRRATESAREAEQAARRSAHALEAIVMSSPVPTIGFDLTGAVRTWNPAAHALFGWTRDETIGQGLPALMQGGDDRPPDGWVTRALRGDPVRGERARWRSKGGADLVVEIHASILRDADGHPTGVVSQVVDATEREAMIARVSEVERLEAVGHLAGGIAHDFNNLLTAVAGYAELLRLTYAPGDPRRADVLEIERAAARGSELVRQLLAFGRRQALVPVVLNLNALLDGLLPMLGRVIGSEVLLDVEHGSGLGVVRADAGQLEQVIVNLVVNARDAMPGGGTITIRTANVETPDPDPEGAPSSWVRLTVADTGVGMDQATLARIFEPFFTTKPAGRGTGLGLATVYGIVSQSGGVVTATSTPGQGTTFVIDLPRVAGSLPDGADVAPPSRPPVGRETVLVVDDEAAVRELARRVLGSLGYRVLVAGDRATALAVASAADSAIDLVLSDVVMPDVRGPALVRALTDLHPGLRALYMTGYAEDGVEEAGAPDLGRPVLAKPFTLDEIATRVRSRLDEEVATSPPA